MCDTCGCNVKPGNRRRLAAGGHLHRTSAGSKSFEAMQMALNDDIILVPFGNMLGYGACYLACEGRIVAVIAAKRADDAVAAMRRLPSVRDAATIGRIPAADNRVTVETWLGGERFLQDLEDDPLPRLC